MGLHPKRTSHQPLPISLRSAPSPHPAPRSAPLHRSKRHSPCPHQHGAAPPRGTPCRVPIPEMVAAVSSASRRSFSSRSFSSSRWCCRCRSSIFFWCVSSMAAKPLSHVACKRDEGKGLTRERRAGVTAVVSLPGAAHQRVGRHPSSIMGIFSPPNHGGAGQGWTLRGRNLSCSRSTPDSSSGREGQGRSGVRPDWGMQIYVKNNNKKAYCAPSALFCNA